jgi:sugar phosphate isomerase/epimerase
LRLDRLEFRAIGDGDIDHLELLALLMAGGYSGALGGEWINWEPAEVHLPRELATLQRYEALLQGARSSTGRDGPV